MAKQTEQFTVEDITKLSIEDIKKMKLDDLLIYINEIKDKNTVIIYLLKIIKYNKDNHDLNTELVKYRKKYRETPNLEDKWDLIYGFIDLNKIFLDEKLNNKKTEIEEKKRNLRHSDLNEIKGLEKNKKVEYETSLQNFKSLIKETDLFSDELGISYTNRNAIREGQKTAKEDCIDMLVELSKTPQLNTNVNIGNIFEDFMKKAGIRAGYISAKDLEMREINEAKAKEFNEYQEKMKLKKGRGF